MFLFYLFIFFSNGSFWKKILGSTHLKVHPNSPHSANRWVARSLSASGKRARSLPLIPHCQSYRGPRINLCASRPQIVFSFGRSTHPLVTLAFTPHPLHLNSLVTASSNILREKTHSTGRYAKMRRA